MLTLLQYFSKTINLLSRENVAGPCSALVGPGMSILWLRPSVLRSFSSSVEFWFGLDMSSPPENTSLLGLWGNSGEKNHEINIIVLNR